ncbi:hypothetical protein [Salipaludibacillus sp. CF4.18]|uniref:hypothetical protein n=1 Tax=Salipaludibacillus sp. CF4.18 TaxID=3373081 RepID=UPI003EE7EDBE
MILIYCDVDENGNILDLIQGYRVIPGRQYDYFFVREELIDSALYKVENRELVQKPTA